MSVVRGTALSNYPSLVAELGGDPAALLRVARIRQRDAGNYDAFIPYRAAIQAIESAAQATRDADRYLGHERTGQRRELDAVGAGETVVPGQVGPVQVEKVEEEGRERHICTLLCDVDTPRFLHESLQVFGGVSESLLGQAKELLDRVPTRSGEGSRGTQLTATEFAKRAQDELGYYQERRSSLSSGGD